VFLWQHISFLVKFTATPVGTTNLASFGKFVASEDAELKLSKLTMA